MLVRIVACSVVGIGTLLGFLGNAGAQELDEQEAIAGDLTRLQRTRATIAAAEAEVASLRRRHDALDAEVATVEANLSDRARHLLGISDR